MTANRRVISSVLGFGMDEAETEVKKVMVTGATGFVGRAVVRELLRRRITPVCLVRTPRKLYAQHPGSQPDRLIAVQGALDDSGALKQAAASADAIIHLVGIIMGRRLKGQTFRRVHVDGTRNVVNAAKAAGVRHFVYMSALGTGPEATTEYHRTKWEAEESVRGSGLDWTILQPSLIHGPDGEFVRLLRQLICGILPPAIPYFGSGLGKVQPVWVEDVAFCVVESIYRADTTGKVWALGGPKKYSWVELYNACRTVMPGARSWKPLVSLPVPLAKLMALMSAPPMALAELIVPSIGLLRLDVGQIEMSRQDNTCDHTVAEFAFGIRMRSFEDELARYVHRIR